MDETRENLFPERPMSQEEKEVQDKLNQIFVRCGRLIEQAEIIFPKTVTDENWIKAHGTAEGLKTAYVFIYKNGRMNAIEGSRTKVVGGNIERTDDFLGMSLEFELGGMERLYLESHLPREVTLEMKKMDDGKITAKIQDASPRGLSRLENNKPVNFFDVNKSSVKAKKILDKCVDVLSESPIKVTNYTMKDIRNFSSPQA